MPLENAVPGCLTLVYTCLKDLCNMYKSHLDLVENMERNERRLYEELGALGAKKRDMKIRIGESNIRMDTTNQWRDLLHRARRVEVEIQKLKIEKQKVQNNLSSMGRFLKLEKLSKDIDNTKTTVTELKGEMETLMQRAETITETGRRPVSMSASGNSELNRVDGTVQKVLNSLTNADSKLIGIFGDEGIGKTTLLVKLNVEAYKNGTFDHVMMVSVGGGEFNVKKIQEALLKQLKCVNHVNDELQAANTISGKLENMNYLVLLDHVFSAIDLDRVGLRREHEYRKVVFASRGKLIFGMNSGRNISDRIVVDEVLQVNGLLPEDADEMFTEIVGNIVKRSDIKPIAAKIVQELGGVPRLIKAVGKVLKGVESVFLWKYTLWILQSPIESRQGNGGDVNNIFEFVYDELSVDRRRCLLYAALFPEGYEIYDKHLVDSWRIEHFICDEEHEILGDLTEWSLLERCHGGEWEYVTMPGKFRDLAHELYQKDEDCPLLVKAGEQKISHPPEEDWRKAERISLMCNRFRSLPPQPKCRKTSTLLIQRNMELHGIPKSFFVHMHNLQFLDLYQTDIKSLPPSLFKLNNLRGLFLNHCPRLAMLPNDVSKLENLEALDIRDTAIRWLPCGIRRLRNLKCLRVSFLHYTPKQNILCFHKLHRVICSTVIKKLGNLEELTFTVDPRIRSWNGTTANIIAKEVASLERLKTLCFYFPDVGSLETFVTKSTSWEEDGLRSYKMLVGNHEADNRHRLKSSSVGNSAERLLRFSNGEGNPPPIIGTVLKRADAFVLIGHRNVQSLSDFGMANMKSLKVCVIEECTGMISIVDGNSSVGFTVFPELEKLDIINLQQLSCIWMGPVERRSLVNLRTLTLNNCGSLTRILSPGSAQQLLELQFLRVENCPLITSIIEAANPSAATTRNQSAGYLPKLEILELVDLQGLNCIWRGPVVQGSLVNLRTLTLYKCDTLTYILSHGITQQLLQLQFLRVENCPRITKVIEAENPSTVTVGNLSIYLPMLVILELVDLQILEEVCGSRHAMGWPSLGQIKINRCPALRNLSLSDNLSLNATDENKLPVISCSSVWWERVLQLEQALRQRLEPLCRFSREEEAPSVESRPPEESPGHGDAPNQPPAADTGVLDHTVETIQTTESPASSFTTAAAAEPPSNHTVEENRTTESHASSSTTAAAAQPSPNLVVGESQMTESHASSSTTAAAAQPLPNHTVEKSHMTESHASSSMTAVAAQPPPNHTVEGNQMTKSHASSSSTTAAAAEQPPNHTVEENRRTESHASNSTTAAAAEPPTDRSSCLTTHIKRLWFRSCMRGHRDSALPNHTEQELIELSKLGFSSMKEAVGQPTDLPPRLAPRKIKFWFWSFRRGNQEREFMLGNKF